MQRRKIWEVDIDITGPISISREISFKQVKGFEKDPFYSNITLCGGKFGVAATVTAYADSVEIAKMAAFVFLGRMVDILIFDNDMPLILQDHDMQIIHPNRFATRRKLERKEIIATFNAARKLEVEHPVLLKAIGWYSKAKISNNTLDSFLSFWNAIEVVGTNYYTPTNRTTRGVINKVYQCFLDYFGEKENWGLPDKWINNMYDRRSKIAHGGEETTAEAISDVSVLIPKLSEIARKLLQSVIDSNYPKDILYQEDWEAIF